VPTTLWHKLPQSLHAYSGVMEQSGSRLDQLASACVCFIQVLFRGSERCLSYGLYSVQACNVGKL